MRCDYGHPSRAQPWRARADLLWENVTPGHWQLVGAHLAGLTVMLSLRMRLSRLRIRELLHSLFGLQLSVGLIDQTIRETARLSKPLEDALVADLHQAAQLHVDETPWPQAGVMLWLWAMVSAHGALPGGTAQPGDAGQRARCHLCRGADERRLRSLSQPHEPATVLGTPAPQGARGG